MSRREGKEIEHRATIVVTSLHKQTMTLLLSSPEPTTPMETRILTGARRETRKHLELHHGEEEEGSHTEV